MLVCSSGSKVPTFNVPLNASWELWRNERCRGGQPKQLWSGLAWSQPTENNVKYKNFTAKLSSFCHHVRQRRIPRLMNGKHLSTSQCTSAVSSFVSQLRPSLTASILCSELNSVQSAAMLLICSYVKCYFTDSVHLHVSPAPVPVWGLLLAWWGAMQPVPLRDLSTCPPGRPSTRRLLRSSSHRCAATRPAVAKEAAAPPADQRIRRRQLELWTFSQNNEKNYVTKHFNVIIWSN